MALLVGLFYLAVSAWGFGFTGFPLDDAWIHQTYARNLAYTGQLAFTPGAPSAGCTAPLWALLLSLGYGLGIPFLFWTYGLGILFLGLTGWTISHLARRLFPEQPGLHLWLGLFCLFEWHLVWAALSGMETILFIWLSVFLFDRYLTLHEDNEIGPSHTRYTISNMVLGFLGGLLILTRPEGLGLVGLIGLDTAWRWRRQPKAWLTGWLGLALGVILLLTPYVLFHLWATGRPLPNTFYAKQAEYQSILDTYPLWQRLFGPLGPAAEAAQGVFRVIFIGPQALLLPGLGLAAWLTLKERRRILVLPWLWWLGYLTLYAVRLPVTYQHGRYQIPVIAWVILLGVWGASRLFNPRDRRGAIFRVTRRTIILALAVLTVAFTGLGAQTYSRDVRFIESEMVATARWLQNHTAPDALIAAHDIGAMGYFTQRPLLDLAGLITPEVIPIIRDETALFDFIVSKRADYLVTFPAWYPALTRNFALTRLYTTDAPSTRQIGGDNMTVYRLARPIQP